MVVSGRSSQAVESSTATDVAVVGVESIWCSLSPVANPQSPGEEHHTLAVAACAKERIGLNGQGGGRREETEQEIGERRRAAEGGLCREDR